MHTLIVLASLLTGRIDVPRKRINNSAIYRNNPLVNGEYC